MEFNIETETDLQRILGQYESIRLEFKASALLAQTKDKIIKQLTEEVSAFANTEGGTLIIGIKEGSKGKKSVAAEIDEGVDPLAMPHERLEQLIASNISPPVPGLRVSPIPLSGSKTGRVAYVVKVPKGTTAYQARQSLQYYGRTEFAASALHDNVIRLLMLRGKVAHAVIEVVSLSQLTAEEEFSKRQTQLASIADKKKEFFSRPVLHDLRKQAELNRLGMPKRIFDEYSFELGIRNDGPITIKDCCLSLLVKAEPESDLKPKPSGEQWTCHFLPASIPRKISSEGKTTTEKVPVRERKLFPEQVIPFPDPDAKLTLRVPVGSKPTNSTLHWTLYVEDAPSVSGVIDLARAITEAAGTKKQ